MKKILFAALALIVVMASCVKDPKYPGVTISDVKYAPTAVQADEDVTVSASITSFADFTANLIYTLEGKEPVSVEMKNANDSDVYSAVIPGQPDGVKVSFYIEAIGELVANSAIMEYEVGAVAVDYSVLRLNELNGNEYDETNGNDKFIEIYNAGTDRISLKGAVLVKDGDDTKPVWTGAENVAIEAGGYLLLYSQKAQAAGSYDENLIFSSGLSASKPVRIQLFSPTGEQIDDFNLVTCVEPAGASYSRNADGNWYHAAATPGAANIDGTVQVMGLEGGPEGPNYMNLMLNELNGDTKFIEIYNKGNIDLPMEGMYIMKDDYVNGATWTADATVVVPAHGYVLLYSEDVTAEGQAQEGYAESLTFHSGLSGKKTVRITLFMADGSVRDEFTRGSTGEWGQNITNVAPLSFARTPDGGDWKLADPTPGEANPATGEDIPQE